MNRHTFVLAVTLALGTLAAPALADPPAAKKRALLVGVSTYTKGGLADKPLPYAAGDMETLAPTLKDAGWDVTLLISKGTTNKATRKEIFSSLDRVLDGVNANDLVLVALSGHGQQFRATVEVDGRPEQQEEAFFCPSDGIPGDEKSLLGVSELLNILGKKGGRNLVLMDACRDDPRRGGKGVDGNTARNVPANTSVMFACAARQQSFETNQMYGKDSTKGHGIFFYRVWQGLTGRAKNEHGEVTWSRLVEYVTERVNDDALRWFPERAIVAATGEKIVQTPHLVGSLVGRSPVLSAAAGPVKAMATGAGDPKAIIRKAIEAMGGAEKIDRYRCVHAWGFGAVVVNGQKIAFTTELMGKRPDKQKSLMKMTVNGNPVTAYQLVNGDRCISSVNGIAQEITDAQRADIRKEKDLAVATFLTPLLAESGYKLKSIAGEPIAGKETDGVEISGLGLDAVKFYFLRETGLLAAYQDVGADLNGKQVTRVWGLGEYTEIKGLKVPTRVLRVYDGVLTFDTKFNRVELLEDIDDKEFAN